MSGGERIGDLHHERVIGRSAHYAIGIMFAALLPGVFGLEWVQRPMLGPALIVRVENHHADGAGEIRSTR